MHQNGKDRLSSGQKFLFYAGSGVLALILLGPVLAYAALAAFNLAKLTACVVVLFAGWMARTWIIMKWKNIVLKLLKSEARNNPTETLQNEFIGRLTSLEEAKKRVRKIVGMKNSIGEQVAEYRKKYGEDDEELIKMLQSQTDLISRLEVNLQNATEGLEQFKRNAEKQATKYKIALQSGELAKALRQATGKGDALQSFLRDEAMDSVRSAFNEAMSDIDGLLSSDPNVPKEIEFKYEEPLWEPPFGSIDNSGSVKELEFEPVKK